MKRFIWIGLAVVILDHITKYLVTRNMTLHQSIPVIPEVFHLTYVRNPGAAFGILPNQRLFFVLVTLVVLGVLIYFANQKGNSALLLTSFGLMLGGAVGNLIDRILWITVIDFFDFRFFPVFNIADSAIVIGVGLFALDMLLDTRRNKGEA